MLFKLTPLALIPIWCRGRRCADRIGAERRAASTAVATANPAPTAANRGDVRAGISRVGVRAATSGGGGVRAGGDGGVRAVPSGGGGVRAGSGGGVRAGSGGGCSVRAGTSSSGGVMAATGGGGVAAPIGHHVGGGVAATGGHGGSSGGGQPVPAQQSAQLRSTANDFRAAALPSGPAQRTSVGK